jgi:hypothetical protein
VGDAEEGVVDGPGELQHGPDAVPRPDPRVVALRDPEEHAVPERGIGMGHVRLEPHDGLPLAVFAGEHGLPHRNRLVDGLDPVGAGLHRLPVLPEGLRVALVHVGLARGEELLRPLVVQGDAVALVQYLVVFDTGPVEALPHLVVGLGQEGLLLRTDRVVEDEEEAGVVRLRVGVVQEEGPCVPDV